MTRRFSALALLMFGTILLAADDKKTADDKKAAKIQVVSLAIYKAPPPKPGTFMINPNGVNMDVMVSLPGRFITGVDAKGSQLDRFTDDKDNALFKKGGGLFGAANQWVQEFGMRYSPDGESVTVVIRGTNPPGKGAEKIILKGSLKVKCGSDEKVTDAKELAMKPKEEAELGPFKVRVSQFGNGIEIASAEENIKKLEFFDDKGKPIMAGPPGHGRNPLAKEKMPYLYSSFLFGKREKFSVKIHYFSTVETVNAPLDLRLGLGLE